MTCVHTGARVHLLEHGCTVSADLYEVGNCVVARLGTGRDYTDRVQSSDYQLEIGPDHWFEKTGAVSTIVVLRKRLTVPPAHIDRWTYQAVTRDRERFAAPAPDGRATLSDGYTAEVDTTPIWTTMQENNRS